MSGADNNDFSRPSHNIHGSSDALPGTRQGGDAADYSAPTMERMSSNQLNEGQVPTTRHNNEELLQSGRDNEGSGQSGYNNEGSGRNSEGLGQSGYNNEGTGQSGRDNEGLGQSGRDNGGLGQSGRDNEGLGQSGRDNEGLGQSGRNNEGLGQSGYSNEGTGQSGRNNDGLGQSGYNNEGTGQSGRNAFTEERPLGVQPTDAGGVAIGGNSDLPEGKASAMDKMIGKTQKVMGKATKNAEMHEKGELRETGGKAAALGEARAAHD